ncbi:hypothetical protein ACWDTP_11175 [Mycobacterium sp. NPDC003449]
MGNRGILHDGDRNLVRTSRNSMWLICRLEFKGRRRELMRPGSYTELFFSDEAVALAAGHRPCAECRRPRYRAYIDAANTGTDDPIGSAKDLDRALNAARRSPRTTADVASLPDGAFVALGDNDFRLVWDGSMHRWTPGGYVDALPVADRRARVLTPSLSVRALRYGYRPDVILR